MILIDIYPRINAKGEILLKLKFKKPNFKKISLKKLKQKNGRENKKEKRNLQLFKLNLSKRVALLVAFLILIVCTGMGFTSLKISSQVIIEQSKETLLLMAEDEARYIESVIEKDVEGIQDLANKIKIDTIFDESSRESLVEYINRLGYLDMAVILPNGKGQYIISGKDAELGNIDSVNKALLGEANMSNSLLTGSSSQSMLIFAAPIREEDTIVGALVGKKSSASLSELTNKMGLGKNGYAYILGKDGTIYAHANKNYIMNQRNVFEDGENNEEFKDWESALRDLGIGNKGVIKYELDGNKRYVGIASMPSTNWIVGVGTFEEDILGKLNSLKKTTLIGSIVFIAFGIILAMFIGNSISRPIVDLSNIIERLSNYDLRFDENSRALKYLKRKDEIGTISKSLGTMQKSFIDLIKNISDSSQRVASSSEELTATSQQVSISSEEIARAIEEIAKGASDQARSTEEGALHIDELGQKIVKNQQDLENLKDAADKIDVLKDEGLEIIKDLVEKTKTTNEAAKEVNKVILNTNESAEKIENVSQMIKDIAAQTNLLALNAAIEAARAGESGRGFSVVAEEIRKLAEQSNAFTEEITNIIHELTEKTEKNVDRIADVDIILQSQTESVNMTTTKFEGIAQAIENIREVIVEINKSGLEMEAKKDEIIGVIQNLSAISEENAAGTEEASASIEEQTSSMEEVASSSEALAYLAEEMQKSIDLFKY
jgi:methyl-accepting chemotaxis protein